MNVGDYRFEYVETPGHTKGHTCLYEPERKILVAGDHILLDITPNISLWNYEQDLLKEYMTSLDKVCKLDVARAHTIRGNNSNHPTQKPPSEAGCSMNRRGSKCGTGQRTRERFIRLI